MSDPLTKEQRAGLRSLAEAESSDNKYKWIDPFVILALLDALAAAEGREATLVELYRRDHPEEFESAAVSEWRERADNGAAEAAAYRAALSDAAPLVRVYADICPAGGMQGAREVVEKVYAALASPGPGAVFLTRTAKMEAVLRELEWKTPMAGCPYCYGFKKRGPEFMGGHKPGCKLDAALAGGPTNG